MQTSVTYANGSRTIKMASTAKITAVRSGDLVSVRQDAGPTEGEYMNSGGWVYGHTHIWLTKAEAIDLAYKLLGESAKEAA